ncbi:MAG TPA: GNAT family N-acetyltransferase, partial [Candidatus Competibacteraceae bacterium]|nr:GNAT family N-acetyltransferase [Candidatus Competibacteraceae bacterium]
MNIQVAETESDIRRCFAVMKQLRTHLEEAEFVNRVQRQHAAFGYALAFLEDQGQIKTVAGFRMSENLCDGKYLYVDDFVTDASARSHGYGDRLFDWLVEYARQHHCQVLQLDSGVQRFEAHRF